MTQEEITTKIQEIAATSNKDEKSAVAKEMADKKRKMNALRKKARNHYKTAVKKIEAQ